MDDAYESIRERAIQLLHKYLRYPDLIRFNDSDRSVTFSTERLIPAVSTNRPRVMLLFSNPHPHSVYQGMFLSPNTRGRKHLFWSVMEDAGWLSTPGADPDPKELAEICLNVNYDGPFELVFYCYYAFPTDFPEDLRTIFGSKYFHQFVEPEALGEFRETTLEASVKAVVTFNKGIFNAVSEVQVKHYVGRLMEGELIQSRIKDIDRSIPIFLTFPTGWRYHREYRQIRQDGLEALRAAISREPDVPR